jgi:peptidoglycan/LPS O-acetylase OafA/YrhL
MSRAEPTGKRNLAAVDLLRFACAMLVVFNHFFSADIRDHRLPFVAMFPHARLERAFWQPASWGWIGVEIFFVISGYVIAASARGSLPRAFLVRRLLRLAPAAWICASISAALLLAAHIYSPAATLMRWLGSVLFLGWTEQIDASYWTLGVEVDFYLLVACCIGRRTFLSLDRLPSVLGGASLAYWIVDWWITGSLTAVPLPISSLTLLPHGCFFAIGMMLQRRKRYPFDAVPALAACVLEILSHTAMRAMTLNLPLHPWIPLALFAIGLAVIAGAGRMRIAGRWARLSAMLGLMTYPLYLLHQDAGAVVAGALVRLGMGVVPALLAVVVLMVAMSWLCAMRWEPQVRDWLARYIARRTAPAENGLVPKRQRGRPMASPFRQP